MHLSVLTCHFCVAKFFWLKFAQNFRKWMKKRNKEISELIYGLIHSAKILKKDGVLAVVTFHSLEDKIVKYFFKILVAGESLPDNVSAVICLTSNSKRIPVFLYFECLTVT